MKRLLLPALTVTALILAGCGSSSSSSSSTQSSGSNSSTGSGSGGAAPSTGTSSTSSGSASSGGAKVTMQSLAFSPTSVTVKVGQTVQFVNNDTPPHNVTYVSGPKFTSSGTMNTGDTFSLKATQAGTIHYFCSIHPFMKGTVVVTQ